MSNLENIELSLPIIIDFIAYSLLMIGIGVYFRRKNKTSSDYFVGNKSLGPVLSALSAGASDMSSWLLMGLPAAILLDGLAKSYIAIGLSIGALLNWLFVAKRLRIYTDIKQNCITIPDFFETRFDDKNGILRIICAFVILIFFTIYISSGFVAGAKLFEEVFNINYFYGLFIITFIIVTYTFLGGYKAVCWTDLIQGLLMMLALVIIAIVMLKALGGVNNTIEIIEKVGTNNNKNYISMSQNTMFIISSLAWGLGYFGQPHILIRFISIRDIKDIPVATLVGISWMVISLFAAIMIGFLGIAYLDEFKLNLMDKDRIFILMSQILFNPWIAGVLLSAILAAIMSTASSQLLVSSSAIVEDFYKKVLKRNASNEKIMFLSKLSVLAISFIALLISFDKNSSIIDIVAHAWAGFGASFGSVILFALFWKKTSKIGAISGMSSGAICVLIWENLKDFGGIFELYSIIPAFLIASIFIIITSLVFKTSKNNEETYEKMLSNIQ
ncbi:sodium:proline symporter [Campylobacter sp. RM5004]|uniref:sodium/proline symporter PutP n=1 Tax=Campylobacter sp. RM5004 TaxID=1660078 RepID=UPI001EFB1C8C|nr:sodium/proline symporter PutP [Campylobacter sp. RM5004]ULO01777.1 sodium:proline symporter [Campylobacter sp. RM5004]